MQDMERDMERDFSFMIRKDLLILASYSKSEEQEALLHLPAELGIACTRLQH